MIWRWESDAFGSTPAQEDPDGDTNLFTYNLRFPGQYYDSETGLHYNYFRTYDPGIGRYLRSDPIGLLGGFNTFDYASGSPTISVDPLGLADFLGFEFQGSYGRFASGGGGFTVVRCKDACDSYREFAFLKICGGASRGGQILYGHVANFDGEKCTPDRYEGYFLEIAGTLPNGASAGMDIGLKDEYFIPVGVSDVADVGIGLGTFGGGVQLCYYIYLFEIK